MEEKTLINLLEGLNPPQKKAIESNSPLLVISGAGCGKTAVITRKISYLVSHKGIHPNKVAAITFTNKAAEEMKERVRLWLPESICSKITITTFHALGLQIIKESPQTFGLRKSFSLMDAADSEMMIKDILKTTDKSAVKRYKNIIYENQVNFVQPQNIKKKQEREVYEAYEERKKATHCLDFEDLIVKPYAMLKQTEMLNHWKKRFEHVLIDEYQDTNHSQYLLFKELINRYKSFTLVGDDDQSVYSWRGANPENMIQVTKDYPQTKVLLLEQNYRSTNEILKTANQLIKNHKNTFNKKGLWSDKADGEPVKIKGFENENEEARNIIESIRGLRFAHEAKWKDFCVLYRSNFQSEVFEQQLKQGGIPHKVSGATGLFDRKEVKDVLAYLSLVANPKNDPAFLRVINRPSRHIGQKTIEKLVEYADKRNQSLFESCSEFGFSQNLTSIQKKLVDSFSSFINQLGNERDIEKIVSEIIEQADIYFLVKQDSASGKEFERKKQRIHTLISWINNLYKKNKDRSLAELLTILNLSDKKDKDEGAEGVSLMTVHSAKGLEYPFVFLAGFEEGFLPHKNSIDTGQVEEELRVAYVAVTRAQKQLIISYAKNRKSKGGWIKRTPSRFLKSIRNEYQAKSSSSDQGLNKQEALQKIKSLFENESK